MVLGEGVGEEQQQLLVLQASPTRKKKVGKNKSK